MTETVGCTIRDGGMVWCAGDNTYNQLGHSDSSTNYPVRIFGVTDAVNISSCINGRTFFAVLADGSVMGWGQNHTGQLLDSTPSEDAHAVILPGLANIVDVVASEEAVCALDSSGTVWCWGSQEYGQTGKLFVNKSQNLQQSV